MKLHDIAEDYQLSADRLGRQIRRYRLALSQREDPQLRQELRRIENQRSQLRAMSRHCRDYYTRPRREEYLCCH